ncbi:MAG: putative 30S ribosomal subunit protein S8 [Candidatus Hodgkinia cicadicola]|nr:MAG: putative 30S ribosomal subunit protein S8 [Candidatus Hodgkinia cicadicola]
MIDPVASMVFHINSCIAINRGFVYIPYSKYKLNALNATKQSEYIDRLCLLRCNASKADIAIEFRRVGSALLIRSLTQVSKPGNRVHWTSKQLACELGAFVLSTCKGL